MKRRLLLIVAVLAVASCYLRDMRLAPIRPPANLKPREYRVVTTGYCECGDCCGWRRNWRGRPVVASGPGKGKPKKVGYTASGTRARPGTLAADTGVFPFGTIIHVPGYGYGRVEDRGSDIRGYHLDLYFRHHRTAQEWGRVRKNVKVWLPEEAD